MTNKVSSLQKGETDETINKAESRRSRWSLLSSLKKTSNENLIPMQKSVQRFSLVALDNWAVISLSLLGAVVAITSLQLGYPQGFPISIFGTIASVFSYYAFRFSQEKFRLDLFEKRWEVYEKTLKFCGIITKHGGSPSEHGHNGIEDDQEMWKSANESFRSIGWHRARLLFGKDIHEAFAELNKSFAWLVAIGTLRPEDRKGPEYADWPKQRREHVSRVCDLSSDLPELFSPYLYFGDYKSKKKLMK